MSKPVIIGSFAHSGGRYFNAFLCSNFPHFISYSANYFPLSEIVDSPEDDVLMKTEDSDPDMDVYIRSIYIVRDPLDVCADHQVETEGKDQVVHTVKRWIDHVNNWKTSSFHNEVLFVRYEDIFINTDDILTNLSGFFDDIEIELDPNDSRDEEIEESILEIGKYKDILSEDDIMYIKEQTDPVLKDLPWQ